MSRLRASGVSTGIPNTGPASAQRVTDKLLATQGYVVGVEISGGGARQSVALANLDGEILHQIRRPLEYLPDRNTALEHLKVMLSEVTGSALDGRLLRVGIAVGGLVDARRGLVRTLHRAHGWDHFPLQDYFTEQVEVPCIIDNNANAAALAECIYGVGRGERVVLYVGLGRGIGGALVVDGKVYHGVSCTAGEIGHMLVVQEGGPRCSCGGFGHLEAVASAQAIVNRLIGRSVNYPETEAAIRRITDGRAERITAAQVFQLAAEGDELARQGVEEVCTYLGIALANIVHLVNPSMIILGGSVAQAGDLLIGPLRERLQRLCLPAAFQDLRIVQGSLGTDANLVGAVTLALQDL